MHHINQYSTLTLLLIHIHNTSITAIGGTVSFWKWQHDDIMKWKHFPRFWPFVWGIHQSPVNSPHKGQWHRPLMFSLICALNKQLSKQSWDWWFETPSHLLWCHCKDNVETHTCSIANCYTQHEFINWFSCIFHKKNFTHPNRWLVSDVYSCLRWPDDWVVLTLYLLIFFCVLPLALGPVAVYKITW